MIARTCAVGAILVLLVSGCTDGSGGGDLVFGEPTAGPRPEPMLAADCADLAPDRLLELSFDVPLTLVDPIPSELAEPGIPSAASVRTAGGIACEWSNGEPYAPGGGNPDYVGLRVLALPAATAEWERYGEGTGIVEPVVDVCARRTEPIVCTTTGLVRGTWIEAVAMGGSTVEGSLSATNMLVGAHGLMVADGSPWLRPESSAGPCETITDAAAVSAALGADATYDPIALGTTLADSAERRVGSTGCGILVGDEFLAAVHVLPGGAWARADSGGASIGEPVAVDGLEDAVIVCDGGVCQLDAILRGSWIRVVAVETSDRAARDTVLVIASAVGRGVART